MDVVNINNEQVNDLLEIDEDHFNDVKSKRIAPAKLQETLVAFANSDGGDLYVGIEDKSEQGERFVGFDEPEEANAIIATLLEQTTPAVENLSWEFLSAEGKGLVLHFSIPKSPKVHYTANGDCYIRVNAQKIKIKGERVTQLGYSKGAELYENKALQEVDLEDISEGEMLDEYMSRVNSNLKPEVFLKKQRLLTKVNDVRHPNVGCILLFDDEPQATLQTRCAVKVYRLRTTDEEYKREQLQEMPITINGPIEVVILKTIKKVAEYIDGASFLDGTNVVKLSYPAEALKEILVNAVLHRDYSLNDDVHVRIFDNRIEIQSPGRLPGYMTVENLYDDRFSRNPNIVRMIHNLPNPVNHDIGEGLNTAKNELRKAGLVEPDFKEVANAFLVTIKHQKLASIDDVIEAYFENNPDGVINNKLVRQLSGEQDMQKVKKVLQRMKQAGKIKVVDEKARAFKVTYVKS
ncbi:ATP-binding protein [Pseudomonas protegens]|uniref:ATP-binding protein n=1 Tax=Pseudomonas protegens TaxID=380021 RepID=UPI001B31481B|nr:ATP-binding protein [Pseudomonas protegens]MBP5098893.1 putative DNA binding domain-containing protein [Pseudomonas protegens]QTU04385.1 putative DNA binding domain-containing protein [Pseudomonas protegens]QTU10695.1 putative DNA binding domain-containing protein [Pseudomonas protegens]QTU41927.1 putative DNA binding domain-containing protein [Pseudomonas protegens]